MAVLGDSYLFTGPVYQSNRTFHYYISPERNVTLYVQRFTWDQGRCAGWETVLKLIIVLVECFIQLHYNVAQHSLRVITYREIIMHQIQIAPQGQKILGTFYRSVTIL